MALSNAALAKLTFLNPQALQGRALVLMPVWLNEKWNLWLPTPTGDLIEMHPVEVASSHYLATAPVAQTDLHIPFIDFMWQRASWRETLRPVSAIADDISNLATSFQKIDAFWKHRALLGSDVGVGEFVRTDLEYVLVVARSVLDHLHEVLRFLWANVALSNPEAQKKKRGLPDKLSKTALSGEGARSANQLRETYGLPPALAAFYEGLAPFLQDVRRMRDGIVHKGRSGGPIYVSDKGFAISPTEPLYHAVEHIWQDAHRLNENVVSLRPLLAHIALNVVYACNAAVAACSASVEFPAELAPGYRVFVRTEHGAALVRAQEVLRGASPWWSEDPATGASQ